MNKKRNAHEGQFQNNQENYNRQSLESQAITLIKSANEQNPVTRKKLARHLDVDDRTARLVIEVLRHNGERIIAHEKGGYFYAENEKQYRRWRDSITARIRNMNHMLQKMDGDRPICSECGEHIRSDYGYWFGKKLICQDCLDSNKERMDTYDES